MLTVHVCVAAAWLTVKVWPPMFNVPDRDEVVVFAATLNPTEPLPLPLTGVVSVIHEARALAVHGQLVPAVTATLPVPPAAAIDVEVGCRETVHPAGGDERADCWMVTASPPIVIVPVRPAPVLPATVKLTFPLPEPAAGATVIQLTVLAAAHGQPPGVATLTEPAPPDAGNWLALTLMSI